MKESKEVAEDKSKIIIFIKKVIEKESKKMGKAA